MTSASTQLFSGEESKNIPAILEEFSCLTLTIAFFTGGILFSIYPIQQLMLAPTEHLTVDVVMAIIVSFVTMGTSFLLGGVGLLKVLCPCLSYFLERRC